MNMMGIEIILVLALVFGISELRDWRDAKRQRKLEQLLMGMRRHLDSLARAVHEAAAGSAKLVENQAKLNENFDRVSVFIDSADSRLGVILREYELNGVPLGYQRRNVDEHAADYIEGL